MTDRELLQEAQEHVGRADDCGRLARAVIAYFAQPQSDAGRLADELEKLLANKITYRSDGEVDESEFEANCAAFILRNSDAIIAALRSSAPGVKASDPMENWLMKPALEWLEQCEHGDDNERCKMIAALLRDLWRRCEAAQSNAAPPDPEFEAALNARKFQMMEDYAAPATADEGLVEKLPHIHQWFSTGAMKNGQSRCIACGKWSEEYDAEKDAIEAPRNECDRLRKDAARYRYIAARVAPHNPGYWAHFVGEWSIETMDEAIDAAMTGREGK